MSKKQDEYFFQTFIDCADYACKAAHLLEEVMDKFDPDDLQRHIDEMHALEHAADERKHEMLDVLAKAFITPIEPLSSNTIRLKTRCSAWGVASSFL